MSNSSRESSEPRESCEMHQPVALLSQTVLSSPMIQWMMPARLRSKDHNDVVFVGEKRVQIKEAINGHLEDVLEKTDFDAPIVGAKIINVSTQLPLDTQVRAGGSAKETDIDPDYLPPQILLLALDMKELVFLYRSISNEDFFVTYRRPLPQDVSLAEKFGRHIAVDPKSRGVAVSASNNYFGVLWLRPPHDLQLQMTKGQLDPVDAEHFFTVDGDILFMEFLYPRAPPNDKTITLLLIVSQEDGTRAVVYQWDEQDTMRRTRPRVKEIKIREQDRQPTMVVPLTKESSFLLVTTTSMTVYSTHSATQPRLYPTIIPAPDQGQAALWTRWARPSRNWLYSQNFDGIYVCREDGWIYYLEFGNEGALENLTDLGQLHCDVDTAFDVLNMGDGGADFIMAAGSMGDGGLFVQKAREHPKCEQRFLNWAPVTDVVTVPSGAQGALEDDLDRSRLFVCSASSSAVGALTELRYGIEAPINIAASLGDIPTIRDIWSEDINGRTYVMISDPISSQLLCMSSDLEDEITALDEAYTGLDDAQTLAAGFTPSGVFIQVTDRAIHFFVTSDPSLNNSVNHDPNHSLITVTVDGPSSMIAAAMRGEDGMSLGVARVTTSDSAVSMSTVGSPVGIEKYPVCLSIQKFGDTSFLFMGTGDGSVLVFNIDDEAVTFLFDIAISVQTEDDISMAVESFAAISTNVTGSLQALLFCGLRSGILIPFEIDFNAPTLIGLTQKPPTQIGKTSIRLQGSGSFALFTCGHELWRVSYTEDGTAPNYFLWRVWITDRINSAYFPVTLNSFSLINSHASGNTSGSLFCFSDGQLLICTLEKRAKPVPRRIDLPGRPGKLCYSKHLESLIVSYTLPDTLPDGTIPDDAQRPYIEFVDPDSQQPVVHQNRSWMPDEKEPWRPRGGVGETITCIFDWMPIRGDKKYHLIAVGTSRPYASDFDSSRGRVILLQVSRDPANPSRIDCFFKHMKSVQKPVRTIASYVDTLIISAGKSIFPLRSLHSMIQWLSNAVLSLPSPAVAITVHGKYVYITTSRNGLMVYEIRDGSWVPHALDIVQRDGLSHSIVPGKPDLAFASSRGGGVRLLVDIENVAMNQTLPEPRAEIYLPLSVSKLLVGNRCSTLSPARIAMYGVGLNGTVHQFLTLEKKEWRLLRFLQNLCERDPVINTSLTKRRRRLNPRDLIPVDPSGAQGQINGDILARLSELDVDYLQDMIKDSQRPDPLPPMQNGLESQFCEMVQDVLGVSANHGEAAIGWLRQLLHLES
ncbi:hypothetical protein N7474_009314 [Penicillium riverlandense]|uniref:uncharacterized protein n=1 Tax=Penicillium riverlandense TaxID=1903569 RepID=UPI0025470EB1|nr:uncharacterized protein N7474_009314 [Penicillium riverlandense]KAJ5808045.1 hypothetical protein N7474_009314 [Penicillium riverlandense]